MTDEREFEAALRASLAERARQAPPAAPLTQEILAAIERPAAPAPRARRWGTWTLPLVAAGAVAAVVATIVGVAQLNQSATQAPPAGQITPVVTPPPPSPSPGVTSAPTTAPAPPIPAALTVKNFRTLDMTFVGANDGWALGTATCSTSSGTCIAVVHTTDGVSWHDAGNPPANIAGVNGGCADPCIEHIRFANDLVGYAFGPSALFMTTDGGTSWRREAGGASALETLDFNVIRVISGCVPGCTFSVQTAALGSSRWHTVALPGPQAGANTGATLTRNGHQAAIEVYGHVAGGAASATSVRYSSTDDGSSWTRYGEPCPQIGGGAAGSEVDSTALVFADDGSLSVLCTPRGGQTSFTATSTDGGAHFSRGAGTLKLSEVLGAASARVLFAMADVLYRSTDGGQSWHRVGSSGSGPLTASWIGFESATTGRIVDAGQVPGTGGSTIWTTTDAGASWTSFTFPQS